MWSSHSGGWVDGRGRCLVGLGVGQTAAADASHPNGRDGVALWGRKVRRA